MSQDVNPYASPLTTHAAPEPSRYRSGLFVFIVVDLFLSLASTLPLLVAFGVTKTIWSDWILATTFFYLPTTLGTLAFVGLIRRHNWAMAIARVAGLYGLLSSLIASLIYLLESDPFGVPALLLRAVWNITYIFAARAFAKK